MEFRYPAIFEYYEDGVSVIFPDLPGCFTCGEDFKEAYYMAEDCLYSYILDEYYATIDSLPEPTEVCDIDISDDIEVCIICVKIDEFEVFN